MVVVVPEVVDLEELVLGPDGDGGGGGAVVRGEDVVEGDLAAVVFVDGGVVVVQVQVVDVGVVREEDRAVVVGREDQETRHRSQVRVLGRVYLLQRPPQQTQLQQHIIQVQKQTLLLIIDPIALQYLDLHLLLQRPLLNLKFQNIEPINKQLIPAQLHRPNQIPILKHMLIPLHLINTILVQLDHLHLILIINKHNHP